MCKTKKPSIQRQDYTLGQIITKPRRKKEDAILPFIFIKRVSKNITLLLNPAKQLSSEPLIFSCEAIYAIQEVADLYMIETFEKWAAVSELRHKETYGEGTDSVNTLQLKDARFAKEMDGLRGRFIKPVKPVFTRGNMNLFIAFCLASKGIPAEVSKIIIIKCQ